MPSDLRLKSMTERFRSDSSTNQTNTSKMSEGDLGTRKTLFVLVIVAGCFAVLWPKVFYPMLVGPPNERMKPNSLDKGCCDVISDNDVNTIKIMSELCNNIIEQTGEKPLNGQEIISRCRAEVLSKCGIDISAVLQEQVRLGHTFKQIADEVRSLNGSLCLKYNFGVSPWKLGVSHRVTININTGYVRQERPAHLRPEMLHPALREKGRAIPQPYQPLGKDTQHKYVEGRPGPVPGVRPPMGGAGHVVHPQQKGLNSMGVIMPIYTIGIVIFFSYTLMKLVFKKKPEGPGGGLYPHVEPSPEFRREVFESQKSNTARRPGSIVSAMSALLDEVDQELEDRRKANEAASQKDVTSNGTLVANGNIKKSRQEEHEQPSIKVLGMEMTASCEGGEKWSRPESPMLPKTPPPPPSLVPVEPPQEIYLEGALPAQSQLLVAESTTEAEANDDSSSADPAVVLASKMTLSVINLDSQENDTQASHNGTVADTEDEVIDESKYTTASGATAAEQEVSEGERTDDEEEMEDDMEKISEFVVDNGVQVIENSEELNNDKALAIEKDEKEHISEALHPEEVLPEFKQEEPSVKFNEPTEHIELNKGTKQSKEMSAADIENISDVINDVIDAGTRVSKIIAVEKFTELTKVDDKAKIEEPKEEEEEIVEVTGSEEEIEIEVTDDEEEVEVEIVEETDEEVDEVQKKITSSETENFNKECKQDGKDHVN